MRFAGLGHWRKRVKRGVYMNEIAMVRGDTMRLVISGIKNTGGEDYVLGDGDVIRLDVKKSAAEKAVISKMVTAADQNNGELPVVILPEYTAGLAAGDYFFDIRLVTGNMDIYTIVPMSKLKILRNVTDIGAEV